MHIALYSPAWPLEKFQNGIVTYVHWMKRELEGLGHQVSVFSGSIDPIGASPDIHRLRITLARRIKNWSTGAFRSESSFIFGVGGIVADKILEVHRRNPIDVVEMEESFGWFEDIAEMTKIPLVVKLHGPAFLTLVGDARDTAIGKQRIKREGEALSKAPVISSPSEQTLRRTLDHYKLRPRLTERHCNPAALEASTPLWSLERCERDLILFVGRFDRPKGADVLMQAFARVLRKRPTARLLIVGPDNGLTQPDGSLQHFAACRDALIPSEHREQVEFLGRRSNHEITKLRLRPLVTVVASRWENQAYTLLEALLQGCPVVSSDVGGGPESVEHCATGLLARSEDPEDFAEKMLELLTNPERAAAYGAAAHKAIAARHSPRRIAEQAVDLYGRAIALAGHNSR